MGFESLGIPKNIAALYVVNEHIFTNLPKI
jgi:hypothetical protein